MKRICKFNGLLLVVFLTMLMVNPAAAQGSKTGVYTGLRIIDSIQGHFKGVDGDNFGAWDNTIGGSIFVGYDFFHRAETPLRIELEYALRSDFTHDQSYLDGELDYKLNLQTLLANVYLDFRNESPLTPYISMGAGLAFVNEFASYRDIVDPEFSGYVEQMTTVFAWQIGAGVSYAMNDMVSLDLGYRYLDITETDLGTDLEDDFTGAHEISLGVRVGF